MSDSYDDSDEALATEQALQAEADAHAKAEAASAEDPVDGADDEERPEWNGTDEHGLSPLVRRQRAIVLRSKIMELRLKGMNYEEIGRQCVDEFHPNGLTKQAVGEHVKRALDEAVSYTRLNAEQYIELELSRLDAMLEKLWDNRDDARVTDSILRIGERRDRLTGNQAAVKLNVEGNQATLPVEVRFVTATGEAAAVPALLPAASGGEDDDGTVK